jgi:hypothetical protein
LAHTSGRRPSTASSTNTRTSAIGGAYPESQ